MKFLPGHDEREDLKKEIDETFKEMKYFDKDSDEYQLLLKNLERLLKAQNEKSRSKISPDTIAVVVGNLAGILLILHYEKVNVITSRALGFVIKGRV